MRVHSTNEVNTHYPENPFNTPNAGIASTGEKSSGLSFDDYLKTFVQQASVPQVTRNTENQVAGIFWGAFPMLRVQTKPEPTLEDIAY
jgi:hypothetical protein